jgi:hypothetical protein
MAKAASVPEPGCDAVLRADLLVAWFAAKWQHQVWWRAGSNGARYRKAFSAARSPKLARLCSQRCRVSTLLQV